jgi:hypothetical protein
MQRLLPGVLVLGLATGCSLGSDEIQVPHRILRSAPRDCPMALPRAPTITPEELPDAMGGHVPHWLPRRFGVANTFASDEGAYAGATWSDRRCRQVQVGVNLSSSPLKPPSGHRVGAWTLTRDAPHGCFNAVLGKARCLVYLAPLSPRGSVGLETIGLDRKEANRIVLSIPLEARLW